MPQALTLTLQLRMSLARIGAHAPTATTMLFLALLCSTALPAAALGAASSVSMHASFLPDRLGASTAFALSLRFSGGEEGVPAPLRGFVVHLPAGLILDLRGVAACAPSRLRTSGPAGCPPRSLIGRGGAILIAHAGSQTIPEESAISIFRGPDRSAHPTLEIFGQGQTPLYQSAITTVLVQGDTAPFGSRLTGSVPPIPTLVYEPDASFRSISLTVGAIGRGPRAHAAAGAVLVPRRCPAGGFLLAGSFTFADHTSATASTRIACP